LAGNSHRRTDAAGILHDICSAIHPLAVTSPFFRALPLAEYGLGWIYRQPQWLTPGQRHSSGDRTFSRGDERDSGRDAAAYRRLMGPIVAAWDGLSLDVLGPLRAPRHPLTLARFGSFAVWPANALAKTLFREERTRAVLRDGGPFDDDTRSSINGWVWNHPHRRSARRRLADGAGGSQKIADALACYLRSLGGEIVTGVRVQSVDELPPARAILFDVTPRQLLRIAATACHQRYRRALERLPVWPRRVQDGLGARWPDPVESGRLCPRSHSPSGRYLGRDSGIGASSVARETFGEAYTIVVQQSLFDPSRAPEGKHTAWAYCHVPNGSTFDMTGRIEAQIERFAPDFRDLILARSVMPPAAMEQHNANYIGGDINGRRSGYLAILCAAHVPDAPYSIPVKGCIICSSSTPPGGGVHGMCGYFAAQAVLREAW